MQVSPEIAMAARTLWLDRTTTEVTAALRARGVRTLVLKGPALATWLYEDPSTRPYSDVDILVSPADLADARAALRQLGFTISRNGLTSGEILLLMQLDRFEHPDEPWLREPYDVVDLHRTLMGARAPEAEVWAALTERTQRLEVAGALVEIPGEPARALIVAIHVAKHGADSRPVEDLRRALDRLPASVWEEASRIAARLDAVQAFSAGLRLLPEGAAMASRLDLPAAIDVETALLVCAAPHTAWGFERLARTPGIWAKLALVGRGLVPSVLYMRYSYPLARRSRAGLAVTYVQRPFVLAAHAGRGYAAWRRARKGAQ
jgi:putative nucleotidyltransferase-like protein